MMTKVDIQLHILESTDELFAVEELQRLVWPGNDTDVVPAHLLVTAAHNGGLVIGAFDTSDIENENAVNKRDDFEENLASRIPPQAPLVGFVFGFPGLEKTPTGPVAKHCSHMLGVHPAYRNRGIGFMLKRAQWQIVRNQGLERITWTYDPLMSRNAHLNIHRLGAVCNTYIREAYGRMRDALNAGVPSDRFQVDWWVHSKRVFRRLSRQARRRLDLAHFLSAGAQILNPSVLSPQGLPQPGEVITAPEKIDEDYENLVLVEIPSDYLHIKAVDSQLAYSWRMHSRGIFENLFQGGYLVTDFVYLPGEQPRSFYVLSHGESTL